jgi:hypothetical protein
MAFRQGAAREHPKNGAVTEPQRRRKVISGSTFGRRALCLLAALLVGHRSVADMLPPRALHAAKIRSRKCLVIFRDRTLTRFRQGAQLLSIF